MAPGPPPACPNRARLSGVISGSDPSDHRINAPCLRTGLDGPLGLPVLVFAAHSPPARVERLGAGGKKPAGEHGRVAGDPGFHHRELPGRWAGPFAWISTGHCRFV